MLEDLLLLMGALVCGDPVLLAELLSRIGSDELSRLCLYDIADGHRKQIYYLLQKTKVNTKVVLTVVEGCTLANQADRSRNMTPIANSAFHRGHRSLQEFL